MPNPELDGLRFQPFFGSILTTEKTSNAPGEAVPRPEMIMTIDH
jgi:hypothetical protein